MKKGTVLIIFALVLGLFSGCGADTAAADVVATTLPVYEFTATLCQGTDITVGQLVTESVSCLHDYTLQVSQMRMLESAQAVVISGAGLEDFLADALEATDTVIDASENTHIQEGGHSHEEHHDDHGHSHAHDPHIWLSPENAMLMARNICDGLSQIYPINADTFSANLETLIAQLEALQLYGEETLSSLSCRELITFHDGFGYFAESFDLEILRAVEEESGSEASAGELKELITMTREHCLPAVFTEENGSTSAAGVISAETGAAVYALNMGLSGEGYFDAMYHNIDTIKEALG